MKVVWILYMLACPNCEWESIISTDTKIECMKQKKFAESIRSGIGYWNDPTRFECSKIDPALH